ncbi:MAG TPA: Xaa-Pro peptidase family protein [Anaerolineaceae bacterium]|mgnify:FL=1|nr:Xaa-Pro peptidase family protein [Anaerolineaceae bacterium]
MTEIRMNHLQQLMSQHKLDTIAINPGPTLTYLTGLHFHLMERPTVLLFQKGHQPVLILPELELPKIADARIYLQTIPYADDPSTWQEAFRKAFKHLNLEGAKIGLEPTRFRFLELSYLQMAAPTASFVNAEQLFGQLRIQKDEEEINEMRRAVQIAQDALKATLPMIKAGISELEISAELSINLLKKGSDSELPFQPIISGGPNSANPHAAPSNRPLEAGDLLVIDWGARSNGYCSDLTRTFGIQHLADEFVEIYTAVQNANLTGRNVGRSGISAGEVDKAARNVIEKAGYGKFFTHRTGHGLGMEDHETPYIFSNNPVLLSEGMTYTVEPGIYLPDRGGVRIEDNMVITSEGSLTLSDFPRELTFLP